MCIRDRWEAGSLLTRMTASLEAAGRPVPDHMRLLEQEHRDGLGEVFLAQRCFWVGEMEIGQIEGVVTTEAGFMHGHEVTRVRHDRRVLPLDELVDKAARRNVADAVFSNDPELARLEAHISSRAPGRYRVAPASDQKRQLGRPRRGVVYTASQLTKLNAFATSGRGAADRYLFPSQR